MRISGTEYTKVVAVSTVQETTRPRNPAPASPKKSSVADRVELSGNAKLISNTTAQIRKLPEVREDLVSEAAGKVKSGQYDPSSEEIADMILRRAAADSLE